MKLYTGLISPMAKRIRICADELGLPLTPVLVDFQKGENTAQPHIAKPSGQGAHPSRRRAGPMGVGRDPVSPGADPRW